MVDFGLKVGDTSPVLKRQLTDDKDNAINIKGFNEVRFLATDFETGDQVIDEDTGGNVTVTDAKNGKVKYEWKAADTEKARILEAEFEVEYSDGAFETFPINRDLVIRIRENND